MIKTEGTMERSYVLFPVETSKHLKYEVLATLDDREVQLLLKEMAFLQDLAAETQGRGGLDGGKRSDPSLEVRYPFISTQCMWRLTGCESPSLADNVSWASAIHPNETPNFCEALPLEDVTVHVSPKTAYLLGALGKAPFWSKEVHWTDLMLCRLATVDHEEVPTVFRDLASLAPFWAIDVLERGLFLPGSRELIRDIAGLLSPEDVAPLLADDDSSVRARAIQNLGRCGRK